MLRESPESATGYSLPPSPPGAQRKVVTERNLLHALGRREVATQQSRDGRAVIARDRSLQPQRVVTDGVPLPSQRHDREPVPQQPCVARIAQVLRAAVHEREDPSAAAVRDLEQQGAVAEPRFLRPHDHDVGRERHLALFQVVGESQVHDAAIVGIRDGDREIHTAGDALVRAGVAERLAAQHVRARGDLDAQHPRSRGRCERKRAHEQGKRLRPHGRETGRGSAPITRSARTAVLRAPRDRVHPRASP